MKTLFNNHLLGGILLIAGTTLGGGMLGFPTATSFAGFFPSLLLFIAVWLLMLCSSFLFLDVNLSIKTPSNMISMASHTLGRWGKVLSWVVYLLLLYSLTAVYIAGSAPLFSQMSSYLFNYPLPTWLSYFLLPLIFGGFIYSGTRGVDLMNRWFMLGLLVTYALLVFFVPGQVESSRLLHFDMPAVAVAVPIIITAFGYHIIIPSLSTYLQRDRQKLRKTILIGSLIPIFVYLLWQCLVLGAVPLPLLSEAYQTNETAVQPLAQVLQNPFIKLAAQGFAFFAIVTSFLGVTLSLADFLTDGLKLKMNWKGRLGAIAMTFIPPLFFVLTYQRGFYIALQYAGAFVAILLVFLPALMAWKLPKYKTSSRRTLLLVVMLLAIAIVVLDVFEEGGLLKPLIARYTNV